MKVKHLYDYKGQRIRLGANNGSNYIFCGKIDDTLDDLLTGLSDRHYKIFVSNMKRNYSNLHALDKIVVPDDELEDYRLEYEKRNETYLKSKNIVDSFKPIQEREIVEIFDSVTENGVKCVIYSGYENGKYWNESEVV